MTTDVEVLVYNHQVDNIANRILYRVSAIGYINRKIKVRADLGFLKRTKSKALLIECYFADDIDKLKL